MYNNRIYLSPQDILDKEFKIDARGFRPQEVDKFLDIVIRDYTEYNSIISELEKNLKNTADENVKLKQEIRRLNDEIELKNNSDSSTGHTSTNLDILKRISQLEKVVFGKDE